MSGILTKYSPISVVIPSVVTVNITIPISWTSSGEEVNKYVVTWERDTSGECPDVDIGNDTITDGSTDYIIRYLEEDSRYFIVVKAFSPAGIAVSLEVTGTTLEAGEELSNRMIDMLSNTLLLYSSIWTSYSSLYTVCDQLQHHYPVGASGLHTS